VTSLASDRGGNSLIHSGGSRRPGNFLPEHAVKPTTSADSPESVGTPLNEADSKRLLAEYGIPVVEERVATDAAKALSCAKAIGFPVVLKGLGAGLAHKTERSLVRLGLANGEQVERAAREISAEAGEELEGFLVQPMVSGRRELVAGLFRDAHFGPVVMFGLGGIFTEALDDVVFRVAPLDDAHAGHMLDLLGSGEILGDFRGEAAADRKALIQTLTGLARLGLERPEVLEVDINPLVVDPRGRVTAVDALVVTGPPSKLDSQRPPVPPAEVGRLFHPRSVAIVGASSGFGKWGHMLMTSVVAGGFEGQLYLVNPKGGEIAGRRVYESVADIPEAVDLAVITVPARLVLRLLPQLEAAGIRYVLLVSSGFGEVGPEGKELERTLVDEATARGILILGPNTMGICNPYRSFYCTGAISRPDPGPTAFMSQSGNMGLQLLSFAEAQGIGIRAFGGTGNEAMITIEDVLDAFAVDDLTQTVLLYLESVKNGRRFYDAARSVSRQKPIVVLKGGRTKAGGVAAASHTGALASDHRVFEAASRQAGIVIADRPMDMLDLAAAFSSLPLPAGDRVAIMTLGGGWGVVTADLCSEYGLRVPDLPPEIIAEIDQFLPDYWSHCNPLDLVGDTNPEVPIEVLGRLVAWDGCDAVIHLGVVGRRWMVRGLTDAWHRSDPEVDARHVSDINAIADQVEGEYVGELLRLVDEYRKPVIGVALTKGEGDKTVVEVPGRASRGIFYSSPERAVKSLSRMCQYRNWRTLEGLD
jgi:acyl-CoA synthetase (NDP forming)